jgi:predicted ABC-type ATPase
MGEDRLSAEEHNAILERIKKENLDAATRQHPEAVLLAGQPGSGKGHLRKGMKVRLDRDGGGVIVVDPDDLRPYHPRYAEHAERDARTASTKVHHDASLWAKELRQAAIDQKMNLIVDGTFSDREKATALCRDLKKNGYNVEVHALVVDKKTSFESVEKRFNVAMKRRAAGRSAIPRYVPREIHDEAYKGMPLSFEAIERGKLADRVEVTDREGNILYRSDKHRAYSEKENAKAAIEKGRETMSLEKDAASRSAAPKGNVQSSSAGRSYGSGGRTSGSSGRGR